MPEIAPPITQPNKALEEVIPCNILSYWKSVAVRKKASNPFSAPETTAVSYPNSRPPKIATAVMEYK